MTTAKDNPFGTAHLERLKFYSPVCSTEEIFQKFLVADSRGAIVGPHGTGKTTLVIELCEMLRARGLAVRAAILRSENKITFRKYISLLRAGKNEVLVIDGAEQIPTSLLYFLIKCVRRRSAILITTHTETVLPTIWKSKGTIEIFRRLTAQLAPARSFPEELLSRHGENIREALLNCYDICRTR